jgi:hypothetical protein
VTAAAANPLALHTDLLTWVALLAGAIGSTPWLPTLSAWHATLEQRGRVVTFRALDALGSVLLLLVFLLCAMEMAGGSYNPFIYFRF